jgi:hypothetical protein
MGTSAHPYFYTPIPVCKGPPLHYAVLVFALLPSLGKFPRLESFYEACADGDIYTPLHRYICTPEIAQNKILILTAIFYCREDIDSLFNR